MGAAFDFSPHVSREEGSRRRVELIQEILSKKGQVLAYFGHIPVVLHTRRSGGSVLGHVVGI